MLRSAKHCTHKAEKAGKLPTLPSAWSGIFITLTHDAHANILSRRHATLEIGQGPPRRKSSNVSIFHPRSATLLPLSAMNMSSHGLEVADSYRRDQHWFRDVSWLENVMELSRPRRYIIASEVSISPPLTSDPFDSRCISPSCSSSLACSP